MPARFVLHLAASVRLHCGRNRELQRIYSEIRGRDLAVEPRRVLPTFLKKKVRQRDLVPRPRIHALDLSAWQ